MKPRVPIETFLRVWGPKHLEIDQRRKLLTTDDTITGLSGAWHRFWTEIGFAFEEISTTAHPNDSVYRDPDINKLTATQRKTIVDHRGRLQLTEQLRRGPIPAAK